MKAIYMVDVPKIGDCDTCPLFDIEDVMNGTRMVCLVDKEEGKVCPLRPLPNRLPTFEPTTFYELSNLFHDGFNACLDVITGETE